MSDIDALMENMRAGREGVTPAGWTYEFHDFGSVWKRYVMLNNPDGTANPPTKHHGSEIRNVRPVYHSEPNNIARLLDEIDRLRAETVISAEMVRKALVAFNRIRGRNSGAVKMHAALEAVAPMMRYAAIRTFEREFPEGDWTLMSRCRKDDGSNLYAARAVLYATRDRRVVSVYTADTADEAFRGAVAEVMRQKS